MISAGWKWIERPADLLWPASLELVFAATLLLIVAVAMHLVLRRAASLRHRVWALTMAGLLLLPLLCPILPKLPLPLNIPLAVRSPAASEPASLTPEQASGAAIAQPQAKTWTDSEVHPTASALPVESRPTTASSLPQKAYALPAPEVNPRPAVAPTAKTSIESGRSLLAKCNCAFILVWALGTVLYLLAMARWLWLERRMAKSASELNDPSWQTLLGELKLQFGTRWAVALGVSQESEVPLAVGWRNPKILLPVDCRCWTAEKRRLVLAHELSHVARHDVFWQVVARLACAVYWFHPLAWLAERRMRVERELACDDAVLRSGSQPGQYAAVLLDVAAAISRRPAAGAAAIAMACRHPIQRRIRAILEPGLNRMPVGPRTGRLSLAAALLLVVLAAGLHPFAPPQVKADPPKSTVGTHLAPRDVAAARNPEKPGVRSVRFRVVNQEGKPIAGAKVKLWGVIRETLARFYPPVAKTDGNGLATIEFPRQTTNYVVVFVWADNYVTAGAHWDNYEGNRIQVPAEFTIALEPGTTLGGIVCEEHGHPIAGAQILISGEEKLPDGIHFNQADDSLRTDAQGRWTSHRVPKDFGRYVLARIALKHSGYASPPLFELKSQPLDQLRASTEVMVMHKGLVVEGVVTDPQGKPFAGAAVGQFSELSGSDFPRTKTDKNGRYRLPPCEAGEFTIAAAAKGYAPDSRRVSMGKDPPKVDLQLGKGELIRLRVVDKQGRPLPGATVSIFFDNENWKAMMLDYQIACEREKDQHFLLADAEGRWSKLWIPGDAIHFQIIKAGYSTADTKVAPGGPECVIVLEAGGWKLSGRVVDRDTKAPITKFYLVEGDLYGTTLCWRQRTAVENAKGEYGKQWDTSGDSHRVVRIEADGYLPSGPVTIDPGERAATLNVELEKGKEIVGVVRGPDGKPVALADVALASATRLVYLQNAHPLASQNPLLARTDVDGRFAFAPQGESYTLVALHDVGFGRIDGDTNRNEITLQPWARLEGTVYIDGRPAAKEHVSLTLDDDGVNIALTPRGQTKTGRYLYQYGETQADDKGHYVFDRVRPGSAKISRYVKVSQEGMMSGWQNADTRAIDIAAGKTLTIDFGKPDAESKPPADAPSGKPGQGQSDPRGGANAAIAKVAGKVIDENGKSLAGADVWLPVWLNGIGTVETLHAKSDAQGRFVVEIGAALLAKFKPWDRWMTVWAYSSGRQANAERAVLASGAADVVLRLGPAADTSFVVLDPQGRPCEGALVEPSLFKTSLAFQLLPDELLARVAARTDAEGRAKLPAISPDALFEIRVTTKAYGIQVQRVEKSKPPAIVGRTVRLRSVAKIEGRITADRPDAARDVRLEFTTEDFGGPYYSPQKAPASPTEGHADVKSDKDGRFVVPALAEGSLRINAIVNENQPLRPKLRDDYGRLEAGSSPLMEIPMVSTVGVRGAVHAKDTGKPIPGGLVYIYYGAGRQGAQAVTDAQGNYAARVLPGRVGLQIISETKGYVQLGAPWNRPIAVPQEAKGFELPPVELVPAMQVDGRLVDDRDRPVSNAEICVIEGNRRYGFGESDSSGKFKVVGVPATIDPAKAEYEWSTPDDGLPRACKVLKTNPLTLRALPENTLEKYL